MPRSDFHYRAFISYSHRDAKWAMWLHRALERYVVPLDAFPSDKKLKEDASSQIRRLTPVFRDRDELPASISLADTIQEALAASENLIVLCSSHSAASQYVNAEIDMFRELHPSNEQKIYALIVEGSPPDCFPPALTEGGVEPIAADTREEGDGKTDAKLKLIAGMLGVGFDRLKQREAKRQRNQLLAIVTVVSAVAVMTSALALWALKERALAEKAEAEAKAVLQFFETKVLAVARPEDQDGGLGIDATIYEAVNVAEPQIEEAFVDRPLVEASIRYTLGRTYEYLGESKAALKQFEKAFELRKKALGQMHSSTLETARGLSTSYRGAKQFEKAVELRKETFELIIKDKGPKHPDTLEAMSDLATSYLMASRHKEASDLFEKLLGHTSKIEGSKHNQTLIVMGDLAHSYRMAGRYREAIPMLKKLLEIKRQKMGSSNLSTLRTMQELSTCYRETGQFEKHRKLLDHHNQLLDNDLDLRLEAIKKKHGPEHPMTIDAMWMAAMGSDSNISPEKQVALYKEIFRLRKKVQGAEHPDTLTSLLFLINSLSHVYRYEEMVTLNKEYLQLTISSKGPDHPDTMKALLSLAGSFRYAGHETEMTETAKEALDLGYKVLGPTHTTTLEAVSTVFSYYRITGRYKEGIILLQKTLEARKEAQGADHPDTLNKAHYLGIFYREEGQLNESISLLEETLESKKKTLGPKHQATLSTSHELILSYQSAERYEEAIKLNETSLEIMKKELGLGHTLTIDSMSTLAALYKSAKRDEDASRQRKIWQNVTGQVLAIRKKKMEEKQKTLGPEHKDAFHSMNLMALLYSKYRRQNEAVKLFQNLVTMREKSGNKNWHLASAQTKLANLLTDQKKYAEAEKHLMAARDILVDQRPIIGTAQMRLTYQRLVELYKAWNKPEKAVEWQEKLEEMAASQVASTSPVVIAA